jgi:WD40 repeat protein
MFKLWDTNTGKQIGNPLFGDSLQFSPDGKYIALNNYSSGYNITILDPISGTQIGDPIVGYYSWGFGPDSKTLIATNNNGYNLTLLRVGENPSHATTLSLNSSPRFSPDLHFAETTNSDGSFKIWDILTGQPVGSIEGFFGEFRGFSPDNKLIYLYSYEKNGFILLDVPKQKISKTEMKIIPGSTLTFSADGKFVVAAQADWYGNPTATWLWDIDQRRQVASLSGSFKGFGINGKFLVTRTNSNDTIIEFLSSTNPRIKVRETLKYPGSLNNVTISGDGNTLAVFGNEGVQLIDLTRLDNKLITLKDDSGAPQQMSFSPDGSMLATLGSDGLLLWNVADQTHAGSLIPEKLGRISTYRFTSDGSFITYIDQNGKVFSVGLEDVKASSDEKQTEATEKMSDVCTGVLSPSGRFVVSPSSKNRKLQIWDVNVPDKSFKDLELVGNCYSPMAFSPDESSFAYSDSDRIWIFKADKDGTPFSKTIGLIGKPEDGSSYVNLSFAADQELLLARTSSGRIFVWDIEKRTQLVATDLPAEPTVFADDKLLTYLRTENKLVLTDFDQDAWKKTLNDWKGILCEKVRPKLSQSEWVQYFSGEYATDYKSTCAP